VAPHRHQVSISRSAGGIQILTRTPGRCPEQALGLGILGQQTEVRHMYFVTTRYLLRGPLGDELGLSQDMLLHGPDGLHIMEQPHREEWHDGQETEKVEQPRA